MGSKPGRPPNSGCFKPGQIPNPGGRPKTAQDIAQLARSLAPDAIKALHDALSDKRTRVASATALLDRGLGRPIQTQNVRMITDVDMLTDAELQVIADAADAEIAATQH